MHKLFLVNSLLLLTALSAYAEQPVDRYGDPLPGGAVQRLGTVRYQANSIVRCVAYSPDGRILGAGTDAGAIFWEAKTGHTLRVIPMLDGRYTPWSIAFSPDAKRVATSSEGKTRLWDFESGKLVREFEFGFDWTSVQVRDNAVAFSSDGEKLCVLAQSEFRVLRVKDGATLFSKRVVEKANELRNYLALAVAPKGSQAAIGDEAGNVTVLDIDSGKSNTFKVRAEPWSPVCSLAFSSDGKLLAVATTNALYVRKTDSLETVANLIVEPDHGQRPGPLRHVAFVRHDAAVLALDDDTNIRTFDLGRAKQASYVHLEHGIFAAAVSPDQTQLAAVESEAHALSIYAVDTGKLALDLDGHTSSISSVGLSPDGKTAVTGSWDGTARLWSTSSGTSEVVFSGKKMGMSQPELVTVAVYAPDNTAFALGLYHGKLMVVDARTREKREILWGEYGVASAAFSPDSRQLAVGARPLKGKAPIALFDVATGQSVKALDGHTDTVGEISFARDGRQLVSCSADQTVRVWDLATGKVTRSWENVMSASAEMHPDGKLVAVSSGNSLDAWEIESGGKVLHYADERFFPTLSVGLYSLDGKLLVALRGNEIFVAQALTGRKLAAFEAPSPITALSLSKDGKLLLSGHSDGTALLWRIPEEALNAEK